MKFLYLNHYFSLDIKAMRRVRPQYEIEEIPPELFIKWTQGKFPADIWDDPDDEGRLGDEILKGWEAYNEALFEAIHSAFPFEAFVTPTDDVFYLRRWIRLCRSRGIPTIMQLKEGTFAEYVLKNAGKFHHTKRPSCISDIVIAPTPRTKQFWMNSEVPEEKIVIAGQPRFDVYRHADLRMSLESYGISKKPGRKMLLFLAYHPKGLGSTEEANAGKLDTGTMRKETLEVFFRFLRRHPEVDLVVKYHPQQGHGGDGDVLTSMLASHPELSIKIVRGTEGVPELIFASDAVVGIGSTALVEAMVVRKPCIFTLWKSMWEEFDERVLPHHKSGACEVAASAVELDELLEKALFQTESLPDRKQAQDDYIQIQLGPVDGQNAERSWEKIEGFLSRWKNSGAQSGEAPSLIAHLERINVGK